jgi:serine/threonine-protein kinase
VLDFGLARVVEGQSGSSIAEAATITSPTPRSPRSPTEPGAVLGTAPYMSPEQARGRRLDKRSDIWSFGVLLYEMLTGASPFVGETVSDSIGAILHKDLEFDRLPRETPGRVRHVLERCLQRDRNLRLRDIGDARLELAGRDWSAASPGTAARTSPLRRLHPIAWVAIGAALGALVAVIGFANRGTESLERSFHFELPLIYEGAEVAVDDLTISPDGKTVVVAPVGDGPLLMRDIDSFEVRTLPGTKDADAPFFSPDSHWVAFYQYGRLLRVPRDGGPSLAIHDARDFIGNGVWVDASTILVIGQQSNSIMRIDVATGHRDLLADAPAEQGILGFDSLCVMPEQDYLLAAAYTGNAVDSYCIAVVSLDDGAVEVVLQNSTHPMTATGHELIFLRDSSLFVVPFDPSSRSVNGRERLVLDSVGTSEWGGDAAAALSRTGTLLYQPGDRLSKGRRVVRIDSSGAIEPVTERDAIMANNLSISPDGQSIVFSTLRRSFESWLYDVDRASMHLLTGEGESYSFSWSPEGDRLAYTLQLADRDYQLCDVIIRDVASGGGPRTIATHSNLGIADWLPDRPSLLVSQLRPEEPGGMMKSRILELSREDPEALTPLFDQGDASIFDARFSPDGRWLVYISDESGPPQVYVRRYPDLDRAWQVSFGPSDDLYWAPDSRDIHSIQDDRIMNASIEQVGDEVTIGTPEAVMTSPWPQATSRWAQWDMGRDGAFYAIEPAEWEQAPDPLRVIVNWIAEIGRSADDP